MNEKHTLCMKKMVQKLTHLLVFDLLVECINAAFVRRTPIHHGSAGYFSKHTFRRDETLHTSLFE